MINRKILVIDNEDQNDVLSELINDAESNGVILDCYQFNVGGPIEPKALDKEGNIDINSTKALFKEYYGNQRFDIIACDYDLNDKRINGIELMRLMKKDCFRDEPRILLYSGLLKPIIKEQIKNGCEVKTDDKGDTYLIIKDQVVNFISHLVNSEYIGFVDRTEYCKTLLLHLKDDIKIEDIFDDVCTRYPDLVLRYNLGYDFNGRKLADCRNEILGDKNIRSVIMQDLIQQTVIYLTEHFAAK